jgi:hypothetical protein
MRDVGATDVASAQKAQPEQIKSLARCRQRA